MEEKRSSKGLIIGIVIVVLALGGIVVYALSQQQTTDDTTTQPTQSTEQSTDEATTEPTSNETTTITFTDNGFEPSTLTVKKGTIVTVKNDSDSSVQFSSDDHPTHRKNTEMNTDTIGPGQSTTFTASMVGTWGFHDHLDDSKTGTLTVTE